MPRRQVRTSCTETQYTRQVIAVTSRGVRAARPSEKQRERVECDTRKSAI